MSSAASGSKEELLSDLSCRSNSLMGEPENELNVKDELAENRARCHPA